MLNKTILALTAALVVGTASAALAAEPNDSTLGHQYSWSTQGTQYRMPATGFSAFAAAGPSMHSSDIGEQDLFARAKGHASEY